MLFRSTEEDQDAAEEAQERLTSLQPIRSSPSKVKRRAGSDGTLRRASAATMRDTRGKIRDEEEPTTRTKQTKEFAEQGKVKWNVYKEYAKTSNLVAVTIYLVTLVGAQTAQVAANVWLKNWADYNSNNGENRNTGMFLGVYFAFGIGSALLVVVQTLILWIFCSIEVCLSMLQSTRGEELTRYQFRLRESYMREWPMPSSGRP